MEYIHLAFALESTGIVVLQMSDLPQGMYIDEKHAGNRVAEVSLVDLFGGMLDVTACTTIETLKASTSEATFVVGCSATKLGTQPKIFSDNYLIEVTFNFDGMKFGTGFV
jgi:hypothetical protein